MRPDFTLLIYNWHLRQVYLFYVTQKNSIIGINITKECPNIPCLMFANDCPIFCRETIQATRNVKHISYQFCNLSSQLVNYHKSKVQFSKEIHKADKKQTIEILQIDSSKSIGTYLGCSNNVQRRTRTYVEETKHRLGRKITWWKTCILSNVGKVVLIESNLSCILKIL